MWLLVSWVKMAAEFGLLLLVCQGLIGRILGPRRESNAFYQVLSALSDPVLRGLRRLVPNTLGDRHLPWVLAAVLLLVWLATIGLRLHLCVRLGLPHCR